MCKTKRNKEIKADYVISKLPVDVQTFINNEKHTNGSGTVYYRQQDVTEFMQLLNVYTPFLEDYELVERAFIKNTDHNIYYKDMSPQQENTLQIAFVDQNVTDISKMIEHDILNAKFENLADDDNHLQVIMSEYKPCNNDLPSRVSAERDKLIPIKDHPKNLSGDPNYKYVMQASNKITEKSIKRFPNTLCVLLKRFNNLRKKTATEVTGTENITIDSEGIGVKYTLSGFTVHQGSVVNGGHHVAYVKKGNTWYYTSDTTVGEPKNLSDIEEAIAASKDAYLLFYTKTG